ncbi:hypothetical protein [Actinomadura sp. GTD37]|uniref:hypothetical protein n=1 Tax=Actinomadura sp. GTD37 TaxID=1778030 RepID=UPI0035BFC237
MTFQARKLRVQLPCAVEGSLIELDDGEGGRQQPVPANARFFGNTCYLSAPFDICHCSVLPPTPGCQPSGPPPCIDETLRSLPQMVLAESAELLVDLDLLPLLKKQLENRLAELELAADAARERLRARLTDIGTAEEALRERREPHRKAEPEPGE